MPSETISGKEKGRGWLGWLAAVCGWLVCAMFCLLLTIELEAYPYAYDMIFPAVLLILFCNILVFLFISTRWATQTGKLASSVLRVRLGEGLLLAGLYVLGRYAIGA